MRRSLIKAVREEIGQISWTSKTYLREKRVRRQIQVIRDIKLPRLPRHRRAPGQAWGISVVRDELDVLPHTLNQLFTQGIEQILIADNGSKDGTREYLQELSERDSRVHVAIDLQPAHWQAEKMSWLAHHAWRAGADWIIPFDADEFWFADGKSIAEHLRATPTSVVQASFHHMVPTDGVANDFVSTRFVMDSASSFPGKVAVRSHPFLSIGPGNHYANRVGGTSDGLHIAHAQYRNPEQVARKLRQGAASAALTGEDLSWFAPHWVVGSSLNDDAISDVWDNITHGKRDDRIQFAAAGPMIRTRPLLWTTWNESRDLPTP